MRFRPKTSNSTVVPPVNRVNGGCNCHSAGIYAGGAGLSFALCAPPAAPPGSPRRVRPGLAPPAAGLKTGLGAG